MKSKESKIDFVLDQVAAYNARDIEKFCSFFSQHIQIWIESNEHPIVSGIEELKTTYSSAFEESPLLWADVIKTSVEGDTVILRERIRGRAGYEGTIEADVLYRIANSKIAEMRFHNLHTLVDES